jgi:hypothetical protein
LQDCRGTITCRIYTRSPRKEGNGSASCVWIEAPIIGKIGAEAKALPDELHNYYR